MTRTMLLFLVLAILIAEGRLLVAVLVLLADAACWYARGFYGAWKADREQK